MGSARPALFALVLVLLLFWSVLPPTVGQGSTGHLVVSTDYELFGTSDLRGGGHVTWTLTGDKATDLRMKILHMFDEYPTIPRGFTFAFASPGTANHNSRLDATEGVRYTDLLEDLLLALSSGERMACDHRGWAPGLLGRQRHDVPVRQQCGCVEQYLGGSRPCCRFAIRLPVRLPRLGDVQLHRNCERPGRLPPNRI